ncbi:chitinase-3-like protein 1 [Belonocnema kinseyi]|uniref:chitinase-3-like protein 1 n=1 Tax=Belonocnema kinseyi TaxID=2817044 RepID=UPI00143D8729|nr:chitinase-3-like protein 1 [Belonocnema kinseyi]
MRKIILFLGIWSAFAMGSKLKVPAEPPSKECDKIVGCYYNCRSFDNESNKDLLIDQMDVSLCTHLFYDCVGLKENATLQIENDYKNLEFEAYQQLIELRKKNIKLKTLVTITGLYDENIQDINNKALTDPNLRNKLVDNIADFVKKYGFNGLDLEYSQSYPQTDEQLSDKENFVLLLKALRERFDKEDLILSVVVDPIETTAKILYDIEGISKYVNFINLKTFDFHGRFDLEKKFGLGYITPMYPSLKDNADERKINIDYVVKYWISQGAPPKKLILGIPFHGISFILLNPNQIDRDSPLTDDEKTGVQLQYNQICSYEKDPQQKHFYDKVQQVPYMYCSGNQIIAYDNVKSIKMKAEYAQKMQLGGAMAFTIDQDDFSGTCGEKFPLLNTLSQALKNQC